MNPRAFQNYLLNKNRDDFSLAFCIIPDEAKAMQLVLNSLLYLFNEQKSKEALFCDDFEQNWSDFRDIHIRRIISSAKAQSDDIENVLNCFLEKPLFYEIDLDSRLVLFLKLKWGLDISSIAKIMDRPINELQAKFEASKKHIASELLPKESLVQTWKGRCLLGAKCLNFANGFSGQNAVDYFESHTRSCSSCQDLLRRNECELLILKDVIPNQVPGEETFRDFKERLDEVIWELTKRPSKIFLKSRFFAPLILKRFKISSV